MTASSSQTVCSAADQSDSRKKRALGLPILAAIIIETVEPLGLIMPIQPGGLTFAGLTGARQVHHVTMAGRVFLLRQVKRRRYSFQFARQGERKRAGHQTPVPPDRNQRPPIP